MARITHVKKAAQRYETVPVLDDAGQPVKTPVMKNGVQRTTKAGAPIFMTKTVADKSKPLPPLSCEACGKPIEIGTPYRWVKPKSGPYGGRKRNRHEACPGWRASDLTSSPALGTLYAAQEAAEDALGDWDRESLEEAQAIVEALAEGVREAGQVYTEGADNMEDGFGHETYQSSELREKGEALESAADEIETALDSVEEFDEETAKEEILVDHDLDEETDWDDVPEEAKADLDSRRDEWADEVQTAIEDAIQNAEAM